MTRRHLIAVFAVRFLALYFQRAVRDAEAVCQQGFEFGFEAFEVVDGAAADDDDMGF